MKQVLLAIILLFSFSMHSNAQKDSTKQKSPAPLSGMPLLSLYNKWEVGIHTGLTYPNTDIAASDLNNHTYRGHMGYGLLVNRFFGHSIALQAQFIRATLQGVEIHEARGYTTHINHEVTLNVLGQIGNISFVKRNTNLGFYAYAGVGYMNFTPVNNIEGVELDSNVLITASGVSTRVWYKNTNELVIPFGVGLRYRFAKSFSAHAEYSLRTTRSDKLDGWFRVLSNNDDYSYFNVGVSYGFGKKEKTIEWVNPVENIYVDLTDVKSRLDMLTDDKDNDGVPDAFDKDNSTPDGVKVYGDGTAIDSDGDGVPDYLDAEPNSSKGATVDAKGKEVDNDGDGIPDSRDTEPNTPKNELVNHNGVSYGNILHHYNLLPSTGTKDTTGGGAGTTINNGATTNEMMGALGSGYVPSIYFAFNSAVISSQFEQTIANIALLMKENPGAKFDLVAHCDEKGSAAYNDALSKKRAEAVINKMTKDYKIDSTRFKIIPKGETDPLTHKDLINRRVDFHLVK